MQGHEQALGSDCRWVIGGCVAAVLGLCGVILYMAKYIAGQWDKSKAEDQAEIAQLRTVRTVSDKKKTESPQ